MSHSLSIYIHICKCFSMWTHVSLRRIRPIASSLHAWGKLEGSYFVSSILQLQVSEMLGYWWWVAGLLSGVLGYWWVGCWAIGEWSAGPLVTEWGAGPFEWSVRLFVSGVAWGRVSRLPPGSQAQMQGRVEKESLVSTVCACARNYYVNECNYSYVTCSPSHTHTMYSSENS